MVSVVGEGGSDAAAVEKSEKSAVVGDGVCGLEGDGGTGGVCGLEGDGGTGGVCGLEGDGGTGGVCGLEGDGDTGGAGSGGGEKIYGGDVERKGLCFAVDEGIKEEEEGMAEKGNVFS